MTFQVKSPILGFEHLTSVNISNNDGLTSLLTSNQDENFKISLINAHNDANSFTIHPSAKALLDIQPNTTISIYFVVVVNQASIESSVINLGAPMIFNEDNRTMMQTTITSDHTALENI